MSNLENLIMKCRKETTFETYAAGIIAPSLADPGKDTKYKCNILSFAVNAFITEMVSLTRWSLTY